MVQCGRHGVEAGFGCRFRGVLLNGEQIVRSPACTAADFSPRTAINPPLPGWRADIPCRVDVIWLLDIVEPAQFKLNVLYKLPPSS